MDAVVETVCVDVRRRLRLVGRFDGRSLGFDRYPASQNPAQEMHRLLARTKPGSVRLLLGDGFGAEAAAGVAQRFDRAAREAGVQAVRRLDRTELLRGWAHAARWIADRHRLATILALDASDDFAAMALVEPSGACHTHADTLAASLEGFTQQIVNQSRTVFAGYPFDRRGSGWSNVTLIATGPEGPRIAGDLADALAIGQVLALEEAEFMAAIGMLVSEALLELREGLPPAQADAASLRRAFARLMDLAADEVSTAGYDLDDAVCARFLEIGRRGDPRWLGVPCDRLDDWSGAVARYRALEAWRTPPATDDSRPLEIRAARLSVVNQTKIEGLGLASAAAVERGRRPVDGPAELDLACSKMVVPSGWRAVPSPAGGYALERRP